MNKKFTSATVAALLAASMAACGGTSEPETHPAASTTSSTETTLETTLPSIIFEETVLVDNEHCTFKITAIEDNSIWGYTLKASLENKTDKDLMFSLSNVSVNGFMCDPVWAASVSAGMKANESIRFSDSDFIANSISQVTDIEFTLDVYDSNDWSAEHLVSDVFSLYPMGEEAVQVYERTAQETDIPLFEDENCTMIVTGFDPDGTWGYTVNVYLKNKTDKTLMFSVSDAAVNGFMCDPVWAQTVAPGKQSNTAIHWFASDFEENGITEVETISLPVSVYDANDWMADHLIEETYTLNP